MTSSDIGNSTTPQSKQAAFQIIVSPERIKYHYINLIRTATSEILLVFPTVNAILREYSIGVIDELINAAEKSIKVKILSAEDDFIKEKLDRLRSAGIVIRRIETPTESKFKMLIVDNRTSLIVETKDDTKASFRDAVGVAIFSRSKATVMPSVTIFESFWRETELYEKARESDRIKDEFVNVAAHELRSPIMPILMGADLLHDKLGAFKDKLGEALYSDLISDIRVLTRNASRLLKLSEDILQVSRIESGAFSLNVEPVDLNFLIRNSMADVEKSYDSQKADVNIAYYSHLGTERGEKGSLFMFYCDAVKIGQTLFNIIDNAFKFTEKGKIVIEAGIFDEEIIIQVRDSGMGIDPEIENKLFGKFVSKSNGGTGLGLYLSKRIIDAHGGRIWGENNKNARGATFSIAIPFHLRAESDGSQSTKNTTMHRREIKASDKFG